LGIVGISVVVPDIQIFRQAFDPRSFQSQLL
jgi:hypothetical protein